MRVYQFRHFGVCGVKYVKKHLIRQGNRYLFYVKKNAEILAPVADLETCLAAVHNGADAVYAGFPGRNARQRANQLSQAELAEIMTLCRLHDVRVYLAFNIQVFETEIPAIRRELQDWSIPYPDAVIVQDIGLCRILAELWPDVPVHASTQMSVSSVLDIQATVSLGIDRFVLARELNLTELSSIRASTDKELEAFIHGALCISFSGQCMASWGFGGRSANRGECAQVCRLKWTQSPGNTPPKTDYHSGSEMMPWQLSARDLFAPQHVSSLEALGIESLKIEGRMKSAEYVAAATRMIQACKENTTNKSQAIAEARSVFSRAGQDGWMADATNQSSVIQGFNNSHQGVLCGKVIRTRSKEILLEQLQSPMEHHYRLQPGDGIIICNQLGMQFGGGRVRKAEQRDQNLLLVLHEAIHLPEIPLHVFCTDSPSVNKSLRNSWRDKALFKTVPIRLQLKEKKSMLLLSGQWMHSSGFLQTSVQAERPLGDFHNSRENLLKELNKWSGSPFHTESADIELNDYNISGKAVRKLRQELRQQCEELLRSYRIRRKSPCIPVSRNKEQPYTPKKSNQAQSIEKPAFHLQLSNLEQLKILQHSFDIPIQSITLDLPEWSAETTRHLQMIREQGIQAGITTSRMILPGEESNHLKLLDFNPDFILVRHLGAIPLFSGQGVTLIGGAALNICNHLSAEWFVEQGLQRLLPAADLAETELARLPEWNPHLWEYCVYYPLAAFHTRYCLFRNQDSCQSQCEQPTYLRDSRNQSHHVAKDPFCRNTVYRNKPVHYSSLVQKLQDAGVRHFRLEFLNESVTDIQQTVENFYRQITNSATTNQK